VPAQTATKRVPKRLRIGVAGLGAASRQILPHIEQMPEMELAAAADIRPDALQAFESRYRRKAFASVEAMCASGEVDAVWVATPNASHADHAVVAAEHGKHVIVEKPMAVTLDEADRMIDAAMRNGVKLVQGHSKIYSPAIQKIGEIVRSGRLGPVIQISTWNFNDWLQRPRLASEVDTGIGGGVCFRQGPHQVDIVRFLGGGLVKSLRATTGRADENFATEGDYTAFLEFEDGARATLVFNGYGFFDIAELTWGIGEGGKRIREADQSEPKSRLVGPVDQLTKYSKPRTTEERAVRERADQSFFGLTIVACRRGVIRQSPRGVYVYAEGGREEIPCAPDQGRSAELRELHQAVVQDRPAFPDGRWGKATLEVCIAMLQSSEERREVALMHQLSCVDMQSIQEGAHG
jgi:phthalate 4,5-cis-dihydrodiol dehydrogenase